MTRDSLRSVSEVLGREQSAKLGLSETVRSSFAYDHAGPASFFAGDAAAEAKEEKKDVV